MVGMFEGKLIKLSIYGEASRLAYLHSYHCSENGMVFKVSSRTIGKCVIIYADENVSIREPDGSKLRFDNVINVSDDKKLKEELS